MAGFRPSYLKRLSSSFRRLFMRNKNMEQKCVHCSLKGKYSST